MSVNQQTVEETKAQIRGLVNEIAALTKSGATASEFYPELLSRIITALAAAGGAIWLLDEDRQLRLQYQINAEPSILADDSDDATRHRRLIQRAANAGQSILIPPYSGTTDGDAEGNPTRYLLVLGALQHDGQKDGLIEIFQRPDTAPETQKGYLRFLQQMCELAAEWLRSQKLIKLGDRQTLWQQADSFARAAHESLDLKETAYIVANEGRRLIGCDRVSVAIKKGRKCTVEAISGQDTIENRSNIVSALNVLATRVVAAGEPLWHDGTTEDLPPQIEEALEDYVDLSYGRNIAVLPLREPQRKLGHEKEHGAAGEVDRDDAHRGEVIGALIVEQIETDLPPDVFRTRCDLVYEHGTRAIANSQAHTNLFLMPLWRTLGRATWVLRARTLPKTLAVIGLICGIIAAGVFVPMDFDLEADGTLKPEARREIFAGIDGEVREVLVDHNSMVTAGQPLVRMINPDVEVEITELEGQIYTTKAELQRVRGQLTKRDSLKRTDLRALEGEELELETKLDAQNAKLALKKKRADDLIVRSPIDGRVVSWEVEKLLLNRPISTGQVLMEIADLSKPMYLEIEMPEKREGHLDEFISANSAKELEVTYILASDPDHPLPATLPVENISLRAEASEEHGSIIKMRVIPDQTELRKLSPSPGTKLTADVKVGRRASGFVLLHEVYEWFAKFIF
ncbi:efflux RND transporter periplasmic adaptor subunit [Aporhodopirellula aestuarii]|uniref:HlyD family efflux transporter periplasmic adaptor subunit n=1 Tax=Aporhodopirellula aestuarii TaxID=2950107 RepID=A0ABT0UCA9_9BACT|nr:HlyD family efflux transporter periplasmic adaptor subunit [Aporhodopirellula aestuarii]MCM2374364.1 HlyD family efflux transporter periplasmic adaptor subunit [Aporhodopirellula aestuarii]